MKKVVVRCVKTTLFGQTVLAPGANAICAEAATMMKAFMVAYEDAE